jgi:hypothetical protein
MKMFLSAIYCSLLLCFFSPSVNGQVGNVKQAGPTKTPSTKSKSPADAEAERAARERRSQARSLLIALAVDARTFRDQSLRARSLARIADALWQVDVDQARSMFRKAWEAAEVADQESGRKLREEVDSQKTRTGGSFAINLPPNLRREVLRLIAKHDRELGEELLERLKTQQEGESVKPISRLSEAATQRLGVARELLEADDIERALQFAEPVLGSVNMETVSFLSNVRSKNAALADGRYAAMLANAANNPQSDANTVSLLSSYIFTPQLMITFTGGGTSSSQSSDTIVPAVVSAELRSAFFHTAESILMRPLPQPGQAQDSSGPGIEGKYLVIKRLLPFFEQAATPQQVENLRNQLQALSALVSDNARNRDDEWIRRGVKPEKSAQEREQQILDRIERTQTSAERDRLYIQLATSLLNGDNLRARDFVSKIEESELRNQVQAYVDGTLAIQTIAKKRFDLALEVTQKGQLTHLLKTWVFSESAKHLAKTEPQRAADLIEDAGTEARRIDVSDSALPQALLAVANALMLVDPPRVWEATFDAVKAGNSAEGFTGEDGEILLKFQSKGQSSVSNHDVNEFNVEGIFRALATLDYERAVQLARGFQGEGPRAVATIAIARSVLEPKKAAAAAKN